MGTIDLPDIYKKKHEILGKTLVLLYYNKLLSITVQIVHMHLTSNGA